MLYTIIPLEYIFNQEDCEESNAPEEIEIKRGGVSLLVQPETSGRGKISRIISSNAQDYLNPEWQPGKIIPLVN